MYTEDELSKKSSSRSHASERGIRFVRYGTTGPRTGYRRGWEVFGRVPPEYSVVDGEGSIQVGEPETGE
jgi:hypothetical protein